MPGYVGGMNFPAGKYAVIYADPPWDYSDKAASGSRGASFQYRTIPTLRLGGLPVADIAAQDCALFMWATMPMLPDALQVMGLWGFNYRTAAFVWTKTTKNNRLVWGMGNWTRANTEVCLLGVRGKPKRADKGVHSTVVAERRAHSEKPDEVRDLIVRLMGDVPRIELFARQCVEGWDGWGDQYPESSE